MKHRRNSIHSLAFDLKISVNTLKKLCRVGIFPSGLVQKTLGGHWRVPNADLAELRARLNLWQFSHRKGLRRLKSTTVYVRSKLSCKSWKERNLRCKWVVEFHEFILRSRRIDQKKRIKTSKLAQSRARSHARQEELEKLEFDLVQLHRGPFIQTGEDYSNWVDDIKNKSDESMVDKEFELTRLHEMILNSSPQQLAEFILQVDVGRFRQEEGRYPVTTSELANYMGMGRASLYRIFGKETLQRVLSPSVHFKTITNSEEAARAEDAVYRGGLSFRRAESTDKRYWDEDNVN